LANAENQVCLSVRTRNCAITCHCCTRCTLTLVRCCRSNEKSPW